MSEEQLKTTFEASDAITVKMTFGLLNELARTVGDIEGVGEMNFNSELRDAVLTELFSERNADGVIKNPVKLFTLDVEPDKIVEILGWVGEHVTDFLLNQMILARKTMDDRAEKVKVLTPTSTGSPT